MNNQHIKPIETIYHSCRFRSRLEARWAVFFDSLGIKWEYEKEGYDIGGMRYLPDFYLPHLECFFEVKGDPREVGTESTLYEEIPEAISKAIPLSMETSKPVYILSTIPDPEEIETIPYPAINEGIVAVSGNDSGYGLEYNCVWCECRNCKFVGILPKDNLSFLQCNCTREEEKPDNRSPRLIDAFRKERMSRFEYGN